MCARCFGAGELINIHVGTGRGPTVLNNNLTALGTLTLFKADLLTYKVYIVYKVYKEKPKLMNVHIIESKASKL